MLKATFLSHSTHHYCKKSPSLLEELQALQTTSHNIIMNRVLMVLTGYFELGSVETLWRFLALGWRGCYYCGS